MRVISPFLSVSRELRGHQVCTNSSPSYSCSMSVYVAVTLPDDMDCDRFSAAPELEYGFPVGCESECKQPEKWRKVGPKANTTLYGHRIEENCHVATSFASDGLSGGKCHRRRIWPPSCAFPRAGNQRGGDGSAGINTHTQGIEGGLPSPCCGQPSNAYSSSCVCVYSLSLSRYELMETCANVLAAVVVRRRLVVAYLAQI